MGGWYLDGITFKIGFAFVRLCVCAFALFELRGADLGGRLSRADWRIWAGGEGGE